MSLKNRKLGRTSDQRKAMLRAMVTYLLENGQIKTTVTRAKEVAPVAEKMITLGKDNTLASYRQALGYITKEDVANKLFKEIAPKYADRNGGYTRIVKIGPRRGDAAEMAIIQLVELTSKNNAGGNSCVVFLSRFAARCSALALLARLRAEKCFFPRACRGKKRLKNFPPAGGNSARLLDRGWRSFFMPIGIRSPEVI